MGWFQENWFNLAQSVAFVLSLTFAALAIRQSAKVARISNVVALTDLRRETWQPVVDNPNLGRVLDPNPNPTEPTLQERRFIISTISHCAAAFEFTRHGKYYLTAQNLNKDVAELLRLPLPSLVWEDLQHYFPPDFVRFANQALADFPSGE